MPKLYEDFGLIIMFYANEHEPVHVHGKFQDRESRAEINQRGQHRNSFALEGNHEHLGTQQTHRYHRRAAGG